MYLTGVEYHIRKNNDILLKFLRTLEKPIGEIDHLRPESNAGHGEIPLKSLREILI